VEIQSVPELGQFENVTRVVAADLVLGLADRSEGLNLAHPLLVS
jgi:hypothetical protein